MLSTFTFCVVLFAAPVPAPDYQKMADADTWEWRDDTAPLFSAFNAYQGDYQIELIRKPNTIGSVKISFKRDGKEALSIEGHYGTMFLVQDKVVLYTDFHPSSSGCSIVAYDLATGKERWKTSLEGLGPISHFRYHNVVRLEAVGEGAVRIFGKESAGNYVEYLDTRTGKTVGHKVFARP
jgi:hypothetical protein